jgi:hypothetical protein
MAGTIWLAGFHRVADVDHCAVFLPAVIVQFPRGIRAPLVELFGLVAASIKPDDPAQSRDNSAHRDCDVFGRTNKHQPRK